MTTISDKRIAELWHRCDHGEISPAEMCSIMQEHGVSESRAFAISRANPAKERGIIGLTEKAFPYLFAAQIVSLVVLVVCLICGHFL